MELDFYKFGTVTLKSVCHFFSQHISFQSKTRKNVKVKLSVKVVKSNLVLQHTMYSQVCKTVRPVRLLIWSITESASLSTSLQIEQQIEIFLVSYVIEFLLYGLFQIISY